VNTILLVEDSERDELLLKRVLESAGLVNPVVVVRSSPAWFSPAQCRKRPAPDAADSKGYEQYEQFIIAKPAEANAFPEPIRRRSNVSNGAGGNHNRRDDESRETNKNNKAKLSTR
jgi:hypothetical protein